MTAETFEIIMHRNNTTLPARCAGKKDSAAEAPAVRKFGGEIAARGKNAMLVATFSLVLCFCLLSTAGAASIQKRRAIASVTEVSTSSPMKVCHPNTPCGWAIYIPFTRRIDYFMKNTCECGSNLACLKTDDDLSVNAYVYRCKNRPVSSTTDRDVTTTMMTTTTTTTTATTTN